MLRSYYFSDESLLEGGCDEAGRGCLAGPVVAACVILPKHFSNNTLKDSKKLSQKQREEMRDIITQDAIAYSIAWATHQEIDTLNILNASFLAMHRAIDTIKIKPHHILIDGNRFKPYPQIPHTCIIKGDNLFCSIAAASILAKTYRDDWMTKLHNEFPLYNWKKNKGYPTKEHTNALHTHGTSPYQRITFQYKK